MKGWAGVVVVVSATWCAKALRTPPPMQQRRHGGRVYAKKEAVLGLGCFWEPSESLLEVEGVLETRVGYTGSEFGGRPTYDSVCGGDGNVEVVKVTYDDEKLEFERLLSEAMRVSKPSTRKRQYNPVVFVASDDDEARARAWAAQDERRADGLASTMFSVERADAFYRAENYHQDYWRKWRPRYALLAGLFAVQWLVPDVGARYSDVCTLVTVALAAAVLLERFLDTNVSEEPLIRG